MGKTTRFVLGFLGGFVGCITALKGLNYKLKIVEGECQLSPGLHPLIFFSAPYHRSFYDTHL